MPVIHADTRFFAYQGPGGRVGSFRPNGRRVWSGRRGNPEGWESSGPVLAARLFVGFNVDDVPTWRIEDVVKVVRRAREAAGKPDASFIAQKGIYQHRRSGKVIEEDGAQVVIVDIWNTRQDQFRKEMVALAEEIARALDQEEVVVELQKSGIQQAVIGVEP